MRFIDGDLISCWKGFLGREHVSVIKYEMKCSKDHRFEAWFRDSESCDRQAQLNEIGCPFCGDTQVSKAIMAPRIAKGRQSAPDQSPARAREQAVMAAMIESIGRLRRHVEENCENVGNGFAEEARKIHYGESERRDIYGQASEEESRALSDEGIEFSRIPWLPMPNA